MTRYWRNWLAAWCWAVGGFGAALASAAFAATSGPVRAMFALLGAGAIDLAPPLRFAVALMGVVTLGWALTIGAVVSVSPALDHALAARLWRRIAAAVTMWFVVDSVLSVATGFPLNAVSNAILFAAFLPPLIRGVLRRGEPNRPGGGE